MSPTWSWICLCYKIRGGRWTDIPNYEEKEEEEEEKERDEEEEKKEDEEDEDEEDQDEKEDDDEVEDEEEDEDLWKATSASDTAKAALVPVTTKGLH